MLILPGVLLGATPAETVFDFVNGPASPWAALTPGPDGNFYGTTQRGGARDYGTVFRMTPAGELVTLVEFTGSGMINRGAYPQCALTLGPDSNLYGVTSGGGANGYGTAFRLTLAGELTTLVDFTGDGGFSRGAGPAGRLAVASDGSLYGTTYAGGASGYGTIFRLSLGGVLSTLVEFTSGGANRGANPLAGLTVGPDGNLYGTTYYGGAGNYGTIFRLTAAGVLTTIVEFTGVGGANRGFRPIGSLALGSDGNLYGTTEFGGTSIGGTIFRVTSAGALVTLVDFLSSESDLHGTNPRGDLIVAPDGDLYGTTLYGGGGGGGTVFRVAPAGALTTLVRFTGIEGASRGDQPHAGLAMGSDGNFYGTTFSGGVGNSGTIFRLTPAGALTTLVEFGNVGAASRGARPAAGLALGPGGNFYGMTTYGGVGGNGTAFRLTSGGALTKLVDFTRIGPVNRGAEPKAGLTLGLDGRFYGTTNRGGAGIVNDGNGAGTVFRLSVAGALDTLVEFTVNGETNRGAFPAADLFFGPDGNFYGSTQGGGNGRGTVFRMTPAGALTTLVEFTGNGATNRGANPSASLVLGPGGGLYGTTYFGGADDRGTIFRMTPAGALTTLVEFTDNGAANRGAYPLGSLTMAPDGNFYGTTMLGGAGSGTVFRMTPAGELTTLVEFTGNGVVNRGSYPQASLALGSDGNLYGTTTYGGESGYGTLFRVTLGGELTTMVEFTGNGAINRGAHPSSSLLLSPDGNFYGTTADGGASNGGMVFRLRFGPSPVTATASEITPGSATLNGSVNPNGAASVAFFEYGTASDALTNATPAQSILAGTSPMHVSATLSGLADGIVYYFRLRAENASQFQPQRGETFAFVTGAGSSSNLVNIAREPGTGTRIRWRGIAGRAYHIQYADILPGLWQPFVGSVTTDAGGFIEYLDTAAPQCTRRFYRTVLAP